MSINAQVLEDAKKYAERFGVSLDGLTEILLRRAIAGGRRDIEDTRISDWVSAVSEGEPDFGSGSKLKEIHQEYYESRR